MTSISDLILRLQRRRNARDTDRIIRAELEGLERTYQRNIILGRRRRHRHFPPFCLYHRASR